MAARSEDYLQPGEKVLAREGRHPLSLLDAVLAIVMTGGLVIAGIVVAFQLAYAQGLLRYGVPLIVLVATLMLAALVSTYWRVTTSRYVITADRVYKSYGKIRFYLLQTTYDKVTDIHVHQSLFGRLGGFGTVLLQTAGAGVGLDGVRDPFGTKERIEAARIAFVRSLIGARRPALAPVAKGRAAAPAAWLPAAAPASQALWGGGPSWSYFTIQFMAGLVPLAFALVFLLVGLAARVWQMAALAGFVAFFFALALLALFIRQKFTRYEVHGWGVVVTAGWLSRRRVETTFEKVTDVTTYQGVVGRLLDYGNISVNTAGSSQAAVVFQGLHDPESVKALIDRARAGRRGA